MKNVVFILLMAGMFVAFKEASHKDEPGIQKGAIVPFQKGKAWTWVETDKSKKPVRVGISIDDEAMNNLDLGHNNGHGHQHQNSLSVAFPKVDGLPFVHALVDWNPNGHEPAGIYDKPHFDFHFYTTTEEERKAIPPYEQDSTKFKAFPAKGYMPEIYVPGPGGVPQMGAHWIDVTTGELNGKPFTQTFLYGSYDGKVTFYEPMITKAFLDANPTFERPIPVPAKYAKAGYYPTKMLVKKENGVTNVTLEGFVYRKQS